MKFSENILCMYNVLKTLHAYMKFSENTACMYDVLKNTVCIYEVFKKIKEHQE